MDDTLPAVDARRSRLSWIFIGDDGLRAGWSIVLFFILLYLVILGISQIPHPMMRAARGAGAMPLPTIIVEAVLLAMVLFISFILSLIERRNFLHYNLVSPSPVPDFVKGLATGLVMLSILVGLLAVFGGIAFDGEALGGGAIIGFGLEWLLAFLLVGLFEEFSFRGYLQFTLTRGVTGLVRSIAPNSRYAATIGFWVAAIVFSIVLFAVAHLSNGGETPMGIISVSMAGLLFVFALWWTGSLWWSIGFHCAWDWAQSYLYGVADSGMVSKGHLLVTHPVGSQLLSGGTTGPEGSVLVVPTVLVAMAIVAVTMPRRLPPVVDGRA